MQYYNKLKQRKSITPLSGKSSAVVISLVIFLLGFSATSLLASAVASQAERDFDARLTQESTALSSYYTTRMNSYRRLLYAGASVNDAVGGINDAHLKQFYQTMRMPEQFPALIGIGYVTLVEPDETEAFEEAIQKETGEEIRVMPETPAQDERAIITYLEPYNDANQRAHGFDMYAEPIRRRAMQEARDSGEVALSAPVNLVQDAVTTDKDKLGVLMYYPIYTSGVPTTTLGQRREALKGYLYVVLRPSDILVKYTAENSSDGDRPVVALDDITGALPTHLYGEAIENDRSQQVVTRDEVVEVYGRQWKLSVSDKIMLLNRFFGPASIFVFGGIVSAVVAFIVYTALLLRLTKVKEVYEQEVQKTKDELLALASHQLRTPATGVKQYVGMLTSGIMGELTPQQQSVAEKAYDANERQLDIINELLYVSKADAGELLIEPKEVDLTAIVNGVVDNFVEQAATKGITILFTTK